jgi:hypothetical protein
MREALQAYVKRVGELAEHVRGNEQATKQSLIGPLLTIEGAELNRLLEPASEFARPAIANIETRRLNDKAVENWKPVLANAIGEWARQRTLTALLDNPARSEPRASGEVAGGRADRDDPGGARRLRGDPPAAGPEPAHRV